MTVIVNKQKLYDRAIQHKAQDHIAQRMYGEITYKKNGIEKVSSWKGCAISCLATEATIEGIKNQPNFDFQDFFNI